MTHGVELLVRPSAALKRCMRQRCLPLRKVLSESNSGMVVPPKGMACRLDSLSSAGDRSHKVMAIWAEAGRFAYVTGS